MSQKKLTTEEIDFILLDLKSNKKTMLECIIHFRQQYNFPLIDCKDLVLNSKVWEAERDEWVKNHEEAESVFFK
jgi:hypothetical protein